MKALILSAAMLIAATGGAGAAGPLVTRGIGAADCKYVIQTFAKEPEATAVRVLSWAQGYMSSMNMAMVMAGAGEYRDLRGDTEAMVKRLLGYCRAHPSAKFIDVVDNTFESLPVAKTSIRP